jgi:hypothetical protein
MRVMTILVVTVTVGCSSAPVPEVCEVRCDHELACAEMDAFADPDPECRSSCTDSMAEFSVEELDRLLVCYQLHLYDHDDDPCTRLSAPFDPASCRGVAMPDECHELLEYCAQCEGDEDLHQTCIDSAEEGDAVWCSSWRGGDYCG